MAPYQPWQARPSRVSGVVILARTLAFCVLALGAVWVALVFVVGMLAVMWAPPCRSDSNCAAEFWPALEVAMLGALAAMAIVAIALPLAWRSGWLTLWSLVGILVAYGTGLWAYRAEW